MNYEKYELNNEEFTEGVSNFFTQLLIEAREQKRDVHSMKDLSSKQPTISYLVGQAGSGKTTLRKYIRDEKYVKNGECVVELDADKLATFHKYYDELLKLSPDDCYKITRKFVKPANEVIHKTVIGNRLNVVKEKVMHRGEADYKELAQFKDGRYDVDINIIAIDGAESFLCCIERDIELIKNGLDPRRVTKADHDRMYMPFIDEVREFAKRGLCDSINIYGRSNKIDEPNLLFSTSRKSEQGLDVEGSVAALEAERKRTHDEILANPSAYFNRINAARRNIGQYVSDETLGEEYNAQLSQLEAEINKDLDLSKNKTKELCR